MKRYTLIILALIAIMTTISAVNLKSYKNRVKDGYNYWLSTPDTSNDSVKEKKPLVVFLHGASLRGTDLNRVLRYGTIDAIKRGLDMDAYVMAPQTSSAWSPKKIKNTVDYVTEHHDDIDTTRIYVIGMSLGGYGTIDYASTYPDKVAAAMAICGGGSVEGQENLNDIPLWIVHGTNDKAVSVKESDKVVTKMKQADAETPRLIYTRVPGMNHSQPARLLYMPEVYEWLFEHSLNDENRSMAEGFTIDQNSMKDAYKRMKNQKVSSKPKRNVIPVAEKMEMLN